MLIRPMFWAKSKQLKDWCNDEELSVLKNQIDRELVKRLSVSEKKYFKPKPKGKKR